MKFPNHIVTVIGSGNPKFDKIISDVLNNNPKFREAAERIARRKAKKLMDEILYGVEKPQVNATSRTVVTTYVKCPKPF